MKAFKRILLLAMALIMSLSLFACGSGDDELSLKPVEGDVEQKVDGNLVYDTLTDRMAPTLSFDKDKDFDSWKEDVRERFIKQLGIDKIEKNACPLDVKLEETEEKDGYTQYRFVFNSEYGHTVPCYLVIPNTGKTDYPLAIVLQGHSTNIKTSVGIPMRTPYSYALQAVDRGYAALAVELRGRGELLAESIPEGASMCEFAAQQEFIRGRTLLGGRAWDVSKAIDALSESALSTITSKINLEDIICTGLSGGATATFYAACYDERIDLAAPCGGFCNYEDSIMSVYHCSCNFIPGAYEYFDMQDLTCLIAPRKLAIITGISDAIFPLIADNGGVEGTYEDIVKEIFKAAGAENNCALEVTMKGHDWDEDNCWNAIDTLRNA